MLVRVWVSQKTVPLGREIGKIERPREGVERVSRTHETTANRIPDRLEHVLLLDPPAPLGDAVLAASAGERLRTCAGDLSSFRNVELDALLPSAAESDAASTVSIWNSTFGV